MRSYGKALFISTSVNDAFVLNAWSESADTENLIMLADGDAEFARTLELDTQTGSFGGVRSQRYSMLVEDGVVKELNVDELMKYEVSGAEVLFEQL